MKKVVYISGTRADFNLMSRTLVELEKHVDLTIIVTGMHFSEKWGKTIEEIKKYGFKLKKAKVHLYDNSLTEMVKIFGKQLIKISEIIKVLEPDIIFIEGDRGEMLAGALVGAYLNIPVIHHGGGDISESIDNKIRYAITMFSDFHLTGNIVSYNRLIKMGIKKNKIFNVGEPGLDDIFEGNYTSKEKIIEKFNIDTQKPLLLFVFHPNTQEYETIEVQIIQILEAIKELSIPTIAFYANADAGGNIINKYLEEYQEKLIFLKLYKHLFKEDFQGLMNTCSAMIGNSSAGLTELPLFKKPFICIGTRQKGRLKASNIIDVVPQKEQIVQAVKKGIFSKEFQDSLANLVNPYGDGKSYLNITNIILRILNLTV